MAVATAISTLPGAFGMSYCIGGRLAARARVDLLLNRSRQIVARKTTFHLGGGRDGLGAGIGRNSRLGQAALVDILDHVHKVGIARWIDAPLPCHLWVQLRQRSRGSKVDFARLQPGEVGIDDLLSRLIRVFVLVSRSQLRLEGHIEFCDRWLVTGRVDQLRVVDLDRSRRKRLCVDLDGSAHARLPAITHRPVPI